MSIPTQAETIAQFSLYVRDVCSQPPEEQGSRLETILARFADTSVRIAASSLLPADVNLAALSNEELAEVMQRHVTFRSAGGRLENSAWSMMLEAAKRLRQTPWTERIVDMTDKPLVAQQRMKEFDPECELHRPLLIVKTVDPGCTLELQIEDCATGRVLRLTTTENAESDQSTFEAAVLAAFRSAWAALSVSELNRSWEAARNAVNKHGEHVT